MFDSGRSVSQFIRELTAEIDVAVPIPLFNYRDWLNSVEQLLYTEVIHSQASITLTAPLSSPLLLPGIAFEDVFTVYADDLQLIKSSLNSGVIFDNTYWKDDTRLGFNVEGAPSRLTLMYYKRPQLKTLNAQGTAFTAGNVMVPVEWIDLVKAKIRGEAYKYVNEDGLAAKWLNDFNALLEAFTAWVVARDGRLGK
jgi:hypothetical protein